jgi:hypothetical protein
VPKLAEVASLRAQTYARPCCGCFGDRIAVIENARERAANFELRSSNFELRKGRLNRLRPEGHAEGRRTWTELASR